METNVHYTIVGAFVIALITAITLAIIWLSSGFSFEQYSTYLVYMQESVTGLSIDSQVEYNGVNVGIIKSIQISHKNPHLVELLLNIKDDTPITQGTVATLDARGVTGLTYIQLKDKGTNLTPLTAEPGQPYPVIRTAPSIFVRLDTTLTQLSNNFRQIAQSIQSTLDPENQRLIKETLQHIDSITANLANNNSHMSELFANTARASRDLGPLLQTSTTSIRTLQTQTLPATYVLLNTLDNMARTLSSFSNEIRQNPSILIRGSTQPALGPGETR